MLQRKKKVCIFRTLENMNYFTYIQTILYNILTRKINLVNKNFDYCLPPLNFFSRSATARGITYLMYLLFSSLYPITYSTYIFRIIKLLTMWTILFWIMVSSIVSHSEFRLLLSSFCIYTA